MMCYDSKSGAFDFTYEEYSELYKIISHELEEISELQDYNENFILKISQLKGKLRGILTLMILKKSKETSSQTIKDFN